MNKVFFGDCRDSMRQMIADGVKVQMCVTSPPYFGLRDYGHPGQLGLEETPEKYIANMVDVFSLVRELLADDGVLWLNIGDSYAANRGSQPSPTNTRNKSGHVGGARVGGGLKPKDLIGIPWMLAFALRADGWYLRQDIIWHKPGCMPESVTDRCTKSHEYIFLLSKEEHYFFDHEAIKEPAVWDTDGTGTEARKDRAREDQKSMPADIKAGVRPSKKRGEFGGKYSEMPGRESFRAIVGMRNKRSVWTVATVPYNGAHFATFPPALIEPCILAGSRGGDIVLDPFFGSGTSGQVAQNLGRRWIGCELNQDYELLQNERLAQGSLLLEAVS